MAHFAHVTDGIVDKVEVVANDALDPADEEASGQGFLAALYPGTSPTEYVQTSYSGSMRGKYAAVGDVWDGTEFTSPPDEQAV